MDKNNLDDLFQEKFKDFKEVPDEKVWGSIAHSLDQQKKRRAVPLWWKLAGVAALIAILFLVVNPFGEPDGSTILITDTDQPANPAASDNPADTIKPGTANDREANGISARDGDTGSAADERKAVVNKDVNSGNSVAQKGNYPQPGKDPSKGASQITENRIQKDTASRGVRSQERTISEEARDGIARVEQGVATKDKDAAAADGELNRSRELEDAQEAIAGAEAAPNDAEEGETAGKKSIFDEIAAAEQEEEEIAATDHKWSVGARVAPVYFNSFGEGSPIHPNFVSNSKTGNVNLSYGLSVAYEVSPKISVRSGVNKVEYGYDTNDIQFTSSLAASTQLQLTNIDYALASKNLVVQSLSTTEGTPDVIANNSREVAGPEPSQNGRMVQQFGYLEVPLEVNYALLDTKVGINLIGGVSSLFLVDNMVTLQSGNGATQIGEANNINTVNFSTNVGFGINYQLSQKIQLNLEPVFKYQLNTFSDSSGNFEPFSIGVYSGLNFKF